MAIIQIKFNHLHNFLRRSVGKHLYLKVIIKQIYEGSNLGYVDNFLFYVFKLCVCRCGLGSIWVVYSCQIGDVSV